MAVFALISPGGAPGVTTTALAIALTWPRPIIVAECDPGGGDILAGLFAGHLPAPRGLIGVAFEAGRGPAAVTAELNKQLAPLDDSGRRRFLAGVSDPRQANGLGPVWPAIAAALSSQDSDVIADCGRLDAGAGQPLSVLADAAAVVMVMRPTLRQVAAARPRVEMLTQFLGGSDRLVVLLVGERGLRSGEIRSSLGIKVIGSMPDDPKTAAVLSDGAGRRTNLDRLPLLRGGKNAGKAIAALASRSLGPELSVTSVGSME
jgi:hypothetical protein